jgi:group I intron endonuclease
MNNDTGIYAIASPSGKLYIGSAISFARRWAQHLRQLRTGVHHSASLQRAFQKYGEEGLVFSKVALCPITDLLAVEQSYIDRLSPAYNVSKTAGSTLGVKLGPHTDEHKRKIAAGHQGRKLTDEQRHSLAIRLRGRKMPEGYGQLVSERIRGSGNPFFGKSHTPETIAKVSGDKHHSSRAVVCVETGERFGSIREAAAWLRANGKPNASPSPICSCCNGSDRYKKPYGYTWRFAEIERHRADIGMLEAA